jgi:hypothetical protein
LPAAIELTQTPFFPQTEHQCGPAALATLLGAAGREVPPDALAREIYLPGREGTLQEELVGALRSRDLLPYPIDQGMLPLMAELAAGRPVLVLQKLGFGPWPSWHYAVAVGYDSPSNRIILRSGTDRRQSMRVAMFDMTWARAGRWAVVALAPGTVPAKPDMSRYVEAAAGLEAVGHIDAAAMAYQAAAERWPDAALPLLGVANVAARKRDWARAEQLYRNVLAVDPRQTAALNNRAEALRRLGCADTARASLLAGAKTIPADDPLRPTVERTLAELAPDPDAQVPEPARCLQFAGR